MRGSMKLLLVETSNIKNENNVIVHVRNTIELNNYLSQKYDCRIASTVEDIPDLHEQFDFIIFISASFHFPYQKFDQLVQNQKNCKVGWLTNEFELFMNDFLKNKTDFLIANFEEWGVKKAHTHNKFLMTNLNALMAKPRNELCKKKYGVCYYGTYRKYREPYFNKYFKDQLILSTSSKNVKKFKLLGCESLLADRFNWGRYKETLNLFKASLYIEDTKTHELFNYMANRFFESLFCNCALFFDVSCMNSIKKDAYTVEDYFIVEDYEELIGKVNNIDKGKLERFLNVNTIIALEQKQKSLREIENFLLNYGG
jgi:hypothetical protein